MNRLVDARAVVTGAGRGIGRAIALAFAAEGAAVAVAARSKHEIEEVAHEITRAGGRAIAVPADITSEEDIARLESEARRAFGGNTNVLVNNAGAFIAEKFLEYTISDWERVLDVNIIGTVRVTRAFLPRMLEEKWARVVNVASTAGKWGSMYQSAYNVSKHGMLGLTKCLALETAKSGVRVNAICPGWVDTELIDVPKLAELYGVSEEEVPAALAARSPIGRIIRPDEVASLAIYLASPESDGMTGQSITLAGGMLLI